MVIQEKKKGEVKQETEGAEKTDFDVTITPSKDGSLSVDYHYKITRSGKSFEFGKTATTMNLEKSEVTTLKDSAGNDLQFTLTIKKIAK